ncbi:MULTISPECIES: hypothetical protein [unclassified Pseudoxanthomonas]|uniref:hypothetical protein n=1 Tax=unclassified Pseudoxanthomonas TaxID=2645906 RepID=UPI000B8993B6|nr:MULTISPECIES: hypothetical protein [unclassified Pseudoxanthomonas]PPJ42730.1 hypothetical protein C0063_05595 [Pseudoxanthomonas sp. KAs_5_3]
MSLHAALLIGALAIGAGLLLYLPFFVWFRWRGAKGRGSPTTIHVTRLGVCWYLFCVAIMFAGFAVGFVAPQSWLGAQVRTVFGALGFAYFVAIVMSFLERLLVKHGLVFSYQIRPMQDSADAPQVATKD